MERQIIKYGNQYAARYKKWYHLHWRYIGRITTWINFNEYNVFILCESEREAEDRMNKLFLISHQIVIISKTISVKIP